jgi:hypothetical protein
MPDKKKDFAPTAEAGMLSNKHLHNQILHLTGYKIESATEKNCSLFYIHS